MKEKSIDDSSDQTIHQVCCHHAIEEEIKPNVGTSIHGDPGRHQEKNHDRRFHTQINKGDACMICCQHCEEEQCTIQ